VPLRYFEEFSIGQVISGTQRYDVTKEEIIEFARKWDPYPFHTDEKAAKDSIFKGLTAPATLVIAITSWLWHSVDGKPAMVAGLVWALQKGRSSNEVLRWAVACGAATASLDGTAVGTFAQVQAIAGNVSVTEAIS
jgi:hypothetical protein